MIIDGFLLIFGFLINGLSIFLITGEPWPQAVTDGLRYVINTMSGFVCVFPVDHFFIAMIFLINFLAYFVTAKLLFRFFNWLRGSGGL